MQSGVPDPSSLPKDVETKNIHINLNINSGTSAILLKSFKIKVLLSRNKRQGMLKLLKVHFLRVFIFSFVCLFFESFRLKCSPCLLNFS